MATDTSLFVLQLVALAIPPMTILIRMLRKSGNVSWRMRQLSFFSAGGSILLFLLAGALVLVHLVQSQDYPRVLDFALMSTVVGMAPFLIVLGVIYKEHKANFG